MPRFYSPEWVAAFNEAVARVDPAGSPGEGSLRAAGGRFRVEQIVHGVPGHRADVRVVLVAEGGRLSLVLSGRPSDRTVSGDVGAPTGGRERADVTISLSYADAAAMSRGELEPAAALAAGRIRVRGDLAVLVTGQALVASAGAELADLAAATTY